MKFHLTPTLTTVYLVNQRKFNYNCTRVKSNLYIVFHYSPIISDTLSDFITPLNIYIYN